MKIPNIVKIQSKPFDPETYVPERPIKYKNNHGKQVFKSFNLLNIIRWRYTDKAEEPFVETDSVKNMRDSIGYKERYPDKQIESNSKVVEWSDGTYSLVVGDEYFDMNFNPSTDTHVYLKTDDLLIHKNQVDKKCTVKPSKMSKRAHKAILKNVNEQAKQQNQVKKSNAIIEDPKFRRGRMIENNKLDRMADRKRARRDYGEYE